MKIEIETVNDVNIDNSKVNELKERVDENLKKIKILQNENVDLNFELVKATNRYEEKDEEVVYERKRGKITKSETHKIGRIYWVEKFKDDSTGKSIDIERTMIVSFDEQPCDRFGKVFKKHIID